MYKNGDFYPGEEFERVFFIGKEEELQQIAELSATLFETKSGRIIHEFIHGTPSAPTQVDETYVKFVFTKAITEKCSPGIHHTLDIYVGSQKLIYRGNFGVCGSSPVNKLIP